MQKVPVNAEIVVEVYDGRLGELRDSLQNLEYDRDRVPYTDEESYYTDYPDYSNSEQEEVTPSTQTSSESVEYEYY